MKIEQKNIEEIRLYFANMQNMRDFLFILNKAKSHLLGSECKPYKLKQITQFSQSSIRNEAYHSFTISKKSGALRQIHAPKGSLKGIQRTLNYVLQCVFEPHKAAFGFVRGKSIVENASIHQGQRYVYNIDLKDFFCSIDQARVWKCLQLRPFNLVDSQAKVEDDNQKIEFEIIPYGEIFKDEIKEHSFCLFYMNRTLFNKNISGMYKAKLANNNFLTISVLRNTIQIIPDKTDMEYLEKKSKQIVEELYPDNTFTGHTSVMDLEKKYLLAAVIKHKFKSVFLRNHQNEKRRICNTIASLCCTEMEVERKTETGEWEKVKRNVLPQGAPTSPVITNIVCQKLDYLLSGVAKRFGLKYSRYADDITFSSKHNVYQPGSEFLKELHRIINEQNFHIKESKTRLQKDGYRKEVTGLLVNEKANVQQRYIKQLRMWLYYWERYGYERASGFFLQQYIADKGHVKNVKPDMANVISGKLDYLKMVKGADNELYLKLKGWFDLLLGLEDPLNQVLNIWEADGIEQAMNIYYKDNLK